MNFGLPQSCVCVCVFVCDTCVFTEIIESNIPAPPSCDAANHVVVTSHDPDREDQVAVPLSPPRRLRIAPTIADKVVTGVCDPILSAKRAGG